MVDSEIQRLTRFLEGLVRVKKVPVRELERRLGFGGGTLNRIFSGRIELKVRHILLVLEALDVKPVTFFRAAYEMSLEETTEEQLLAVLQRMLGDPPPKKGKPVPTAELRESVFEVLREIGFLPKEEEGGPMDDPKKR